MCMFHNRIRMKCFVLSDIHLEGYEQYPGLNAFLHCDALPDFICLCGDIGDPRQKSYEQFLRECAEYVRIKTFVVLGNHEFHGDTVENTKSLVEYICRSIGEKIVLLDNSTYDVGKFRFAGTTLWCNINVNEKQTIVSRVKDFSHITDWTVERCISEHSASVSWLREQVLKATNQGKRLVILTHHVPLSCVGNPSHINSPITSAYETDLREFIEENNIAYWFYGHNHYSSRVRIGKTIVMSNQVRDTKHNGLLDLL